MPKSGYWYLTGKACVYWLRAGTYFYLGHSINGLVTDGNTKLCCSGFILALFQSDTANKIDSEHTRDYKKLFRVCEVQILHVTVIKLKVYQLFWLNF